MIGAEVAPFGPFASYEDVSDCLVRHAREQPDAPAVIFLADGEEETDRLSFAQLLDRALSLAYVLRAEGLAGQPVIIPAQTSIETAVGFFATLFADAIAVPISTQLRGAAANRLRAVATSCGASAIIEGPGADAVIEVLPGLRRLTGGEGRADPTHAGDPNTPALLQYTSGSTSVPKGVIISRGNISVNADQVQRSYGMHSKSRMMTWLPLFHDMGLMSLILSVKLGVACVLMPPLAFLQRPHRWALAMSRHGATIAGGPNFGFDLAAARAAEALAAGIDLSKWETAFCGSEPIRPATLARFAAAYAPAGLAPETIMPTYGMAEATVLVTGGRWSVERTEYPVSCGKVVDGGTIRIVALDGDPVAMPDGEPGEIWLKGPQIGQGYLNLAEESARTFGATLGDEGPFLRTGDIGCLKDGELYVLGRHKDLLIHRGTNIHPVDVEASVAGGDPAFGNAPGALFAIEGGADSGETAVLVQEINRHYVRGADPVALQRRIADIAADDHGLRLKHILLVRPGTIPRTASGKVQRSESKRQYLDHGFADRLIAAPAGLQPVK